MSLPAHLARAVESARALNRPRSEGKVRAIRFSTLEALCRALDCQPGELLRYDGPRAPQRLPRADEQAA